MNASAHANSLTWMTDTGLARSAHGAPRWPSSPACCRSAARWMPELDSLGACTRDAGFARALASQTLRQHGRAGRGAAQVHGQAAGAAQGRRRQRDPAAGRLRASDPESRAPCRGGCRQRAGGQGQQGGAFQAADQCGAAQGRRGRRSGAVRAGPRAPLHARLAVVALDGAVWRRDGARHRARAPAGSAAGHCAEIGRCRLPESEALFGTVAAV